MTDYKPEIIQDIGQNLKKERKSAQLTIEHLSRMSGVSGITISNIENHRSNPTVTVLWKLAEALNVPFTHLFGAKSTIPVSIAKLATHYEIPDPESNWYVEPIFNQADMEVYRVKLKANSSYSMTPQHLNSIEVVTVMTGKLSLMIGEETYEVDTFESINFSASNKHTYINETNEDIYLNIVVKYQNI